MTPMSAMHNSILEYIPISIFPVGGIVFRDNSLMITISNGVLSSCKP